MPKNSKLVLQIKKTKRQIILRTIEQIRNKKVRKILQKRQGYEEEKTSPWFFLFRKFRTVDSPNYCHPLPIFSNNSSLPEFLVFSEEKKRLSFNKKNLCFCFDSKKC